MNDFLVYLHTFFRIVILIVFTISFISKLLSLQSFAKAIRNFRILPSTLVYPVAGLFMVAELAVLGSMLVGGPLLMPGLWLSLFLLGVFSIALAQVVLRKINTPCNCFGNTEKPVTKSDMVRNSLFGLCALLSILTVSDSAVANSPMTFFVGFPMALIFVLLCINLQDLIAVFQLNRDS